MAQRCQGCGLESALGVGYQQVHRSFRLKQRTLCPPCVAARAKREGRYEWLFVAGLGVFAAALGGWGAGGRFALSVLVWVVLSVPAVFLHELAHAWMARGLGLFVFRVQIGTGRTRWRGSLFGFDVEVKTLPLSGLTMAAPTEPRLARAKMFATTLAGPLMNAALAGLGFLALEGLPPRSLGAFLASTFIRVNALTALLNLFPFRLDTVVGKAWSDGGRLLTLPFLKAAKIDEMHGAYFLLRATREREARDYAAALDWTDRGLQVHPDSAPLQVLRGLLLLDLGSLEDARELFLAMAFDEAMLPATRAVVLNNLAWTDFLGERPDRLQEADRCSREALEMASWLPAFMGTRGSVLIALGRADEGLPLLERSFAAHTDDSSKALNACCRALGTLAKGDPAAAAQFLAAAEKLDPGCALLARVRAALGPATGVSTRPSSALSGLTSGGPSETQGVALGY